MAKRNKRRKDRPRPYNPSGPAYSGRVRLRPPHIVIDSSLAWYAIWAAAKAERDVERGLRELGFKTFLPSEANRQVRRGVVKPIARNPVGRYLFVGLTKASPEFGKVGALLRSDPRRLAGVLITVEGVPLRIPDAAIQAYANVLNRRCIVIQGGPVARLMALMAQFDDMRLRQTSCGQSEAA